jgi:hypothetical protein
MVPHHRKFASPEHLGSSFRLLGQQVRIFLDKVLMQMFEYPLTEKGMALFIADWGKVSRGQKYSRYLSCD